MGKDTRTKGKRTMAAIKSGAQALLRRAARKLDDVGLTAVEWARIDVDEATLLLDLYWSLVPDGEIPREERDEPEPRKAGRR